MKLQAHIAGAFLGALTLLLPPLSALRSVCDSLDFGVVSSYVKKRETVANRCEMDLRDCRAVLRKCYMSGRKTMQLDVAIVCPSWWNFFIPPSHDISVWGMIDHEGRVKKPHCANVWFDTKTISSEADIPFVTYIDLDPNQTKGFVARPQGQEIDTYRMFRICFEERYVNRQNREHCYEFSSE